MKAEVGKAQVRISFKFVADGVDTDDAFYARIKPRIQISPLKVTKFNDKAFKTLIVRTMQRHPELKRTKK